MVTGGIVAAGMRLRLALALWLLAARSQPDIDVTLRGSRVVVRAVGAPLADILTRFGQATGAQVVYEAPRPRQLVTVVIEADSPAAAPSGFTDTFFGRGPQRLRRGRHSPRPAEVPGQPDLLQLPSGASSASRWTRTTP